MPLFSKSGLLKLCLQLSPQLRVELRLSQLGFHLALYLDLRVDLLIELALHIEFRRAWTYTAVSDLGGFADITRRGQLDVDSVALGPRQRLVDPGRLTRLLIVLCRHDRAVLRRRRPLSGLLVRHLRGHADLIETLDQLHAVVVVAEDRHLSW